MIWQQRLIGLGGNSAQRGEEMKWVTITPKTEVSADAMWDLNAIEDYDFNVAQRQMQSVQHYVIKEKYPKISMATLVVI